MALLLVPASSVGSVRPGRSPVPKAGRLGNSTSDGTTVGHTTKAACDQFYGTPSEQLGVAPDSRRHVVVGLEATVGGSKDEGLHTCT